MNIPRIIKSLNSTLHTLLIYAPDVSFSSKMAKSLTKLQNIRDFECRNIRITKPFVAFLKLNQAHMTRLVCCSSALSKSDAECFSAISQLKNLEILEISLRKYTNAQKITGCLPKLRSLTITLIDTIQVFLDSLDGSALTELTIWQDSKGVAPNILRFQQLRTLIYNGDGYMDHLLLIEYLPHLTTLKRRTTPMAGKSLREISTYLRENNRNLHLEFRGNNSYQTIELDM